jgi:hypothetical protein
MGTNTESILEDPAYIGLRQKRSRTHLEYDQLVEEFFQAATKLYGRSVLFQVSALDSRDICCNESFCFFYVSLKTSVTTTLSVSWKTIVTRRIVSMTIFKALPR